MGIGVMMKGLTLAVVGLVAASVYATSASAAAVSVSKSVFTTPDGRRCVVAVKKVRNDFGDVRVSKVKRCNDGFGGGGFGGGGFGGGGFGDGGFGDGGFGFRSRRS
jgi:hypothetical protein